MANCPMTTSKINAVGVWFYSLSSKRCLYLLRNDLKYPEHWALPGGKIEDGEVILDAITRECQEEMGIMPKYNKLIPIDKFTGNNNYFTYHTFFCVIGDEFLPSLNHEHLGFSWIDIGVKPKPLHPGFWSTLKSEELHTKVKTAIDLY